MAKIDNPNQSRTTELMDKWQLLRQEPGYLRTQIGAGSIGHACERFLWYNFRWVKYDMVPPRIKRLFDHGNMYEDALVQELEKIGFVLSDTGNQQRYYSLGPHMGGSPDGIIISGVPESPFIPHLLECKSHNENQFNKLVTSGVRESHFQHWVQCQVYMYAAKLDRALYVAVCKNDSRVYTERVRYEKDVAEAIIERGRDIVFTLEVPDKPANLTPDSEECTYCPMKELCEGKSERRMEGTLINCRTCAWGIATEDENGKGTWTCALEDAERNKSRQTQGCKDHTMHPHLVPWELVTADPHAGNITYVVQGKEFVNGRGGHKTSDLFFYEDRVKVEG